MLDFNISKKASNSAIHDGTPRAAKCYRRAQAVPPWPNCRVLAWRSRRAARSLELVLVVLTNGGEAAALNQPGDGRHCGRPSKVEMHTINAKARRSGGVAAVFRLRLPVSSIARSRARKRR